MQVSDFKKRAFKMFLLGFKQMRDPYYQGFAAQVSFYLMLSIVPILLLLTQVLGLFNLTVERAMQVFEMYTGRSVSGWMHNMFNFRYVGFGNIVFIAIALWAGSRASFAIMRITNYTLTEGQSTGRNYFIERIRSIETIIITILTVTFSLLILAYGKIILEFVIELFRINDSGKYVDSIWLWLRWVLGFALYFLMVSFNYYILPTERMKFREVIPGSIFASAGMMIVTIVYSKYARSMADYDLLYGALSSVVGIMFWFYLLSWVLCLGVLCNKVWAETSPESDG